MRIMHKLFVFSFVVVMSGVGQAAAEVPVEDKVVRKTTEETREKLVDFIQNVFPERLRESFGELGLVNSANKSQGGRELNASNYERRAGVVMRGRVDAALKRGGIPEQYCWFGSNTRGFNAIEDYTHKKAAEIFKESSDILNGAKGSIAEHGGANAKVLTYAQAVQDCSVNAMGGDVACVNAGLDYMTDAKHLMDDVIDPAEMQRALTSEQIKWASFAVPADSNPDRYENPNARTRMELVEEKALASLASVVAAANSKDLALRAKMEGKISSIETLRETLLTNGAMSKEVVDEWIPEDGTSYMGYMKAFVGAQMHSDLNKEKLNENPDTLAIILASNAMMQTSMMHKIFEAAVDQRAIASAQLLINVHKNLKLPLDREKAAANAGTVASR